MVTDNHERVFVLGATGNVGSAVVEELIKQGALITVYTRTPKKINESPGTTIIQGEYTDLKPFNEAIQGHSRLFLIVPEIDDMASIKIDIAKTAYEAGVKQIVHVSAKSVPWRHYQAALPFQIAEKAIYNLPNRNGAGFVSLRPCPFMTNILFTVDTIQKQNTFMDPAEPDELQEWISPRDVGQVAARILLDPVEKHGDVAYELVGDVQSPEKRAQMLTSVLGRKIEYTQVSSETLYEMLLQVGFSHALAFGAATHQDKNPVVTRGLSILLGRKPESCQDWFNNNKNTFV
ncbi:hypothetical protein BDA99DRAFT_567671 [Phascolomyces articulosus]|uniref:NmrA-like domain-containing protein n=1 Tax=Phascolomyces articulosus TaxID=60185 RepID=A0AAD5PJE1_9FUNG|nr:hypothetical protein BDA99DRAFT_567671 [Phascolomyces articulosus]